MLKLQRKLNGGERHETANNWTLVTNASIKQIHIDTRFANDYKLQAFRCDCKPGTVQVIVAPPTDQRLSIP